MNSNNLIVMLDPRGVITSGGIDVINRQAEYAKQLNLISGSAKTSFLIISSSQKSIFTKIKKFNFNLTSVSKPTYNSYRFSKLAFQMLKTIDSDVKLFVVGDPWESYVSAYFLKKYLKKSIPIQIQVHADIADPRWRKISIRNLIRFWIAKKTLLDASSVRCVSWQQKLNLIKYFGIDEGIISVIPIPIRTSKPIWNKSNRPRTIGFIGRIHMDRGIWHFIDLIKTLNQRDKSFEILIAGDGPEKVKFFSKLESAFPKNRIKYVGQIDQQKLHRTWKSVGVLVSMAPVESYGRVLRESLLAGVPVWATASSGVVDLLDSADPGTVRVLDLEKNESDLHKDFESLLRVKVGPKFKDKFIKENNSYSDKLVKSWIDTIENFKK